MCIRDSVWCERLFSPWTDLDKVMREQHIPLFALESQDPVKNFDFLGFTIQYEMCYTNILQVLDLSGIPLLVLFVQIKKRIVLGLTLTDVEHVKECCQRLRIVCARTAADDDRVLLRTIFRMQRKDVYKRQVLPCYPRRWQSFTTMRFRRSSETDVYKRRIRRNASPSPTRWLL